MKKVLLVVVALAVVAGGVLLYLNRHRLFRPDFDKVGGTEIVFEVAPQEKEPDLDALCRVLARRLDPNGAAGVVVRPEGERRVAVRVPNGKLHDELVAAARDSAWRPGRLEFCILANPEDDAEALTAARETLRKAGKDDLARRARRGQPPPAPIGEGGKRTFAVRLADEPAHSYRWVAMSKDYVRACRLDTDEVDPESGEKMANPLRAQLEESSKTGQPFQVPGGLVWLRQSAGKDREFFVLVREALPGQEITGDGFAHVTAGKNGQGRPCVDFTFDDATGDRFLALTTKNKPTGGEAGFRRPLAIIHDERVLSAPVLLSPIRKRGQITAAFSQAEVDRLVVILRGGSLPVRLLATPVSDKTIEPGR